LNDKQMQIPTLYHEADMHNIEESMTYMPQSYLTLLWPWQAGGKACNNKMFLLLRNAIQFIFCCTQAQTDHVTESHNGLGYKNMINWGHKYNHQWMLLSNTHRIIPNLKVTSTVTHMFL